MNDEKPRRGADALVDAIVATGACRVFTLSGNHIMPVFDAAIGSGLQLVHTRHEAAAVHMADAWARLTGEVGIALVTGGPGHANAVSALYTASMSDSPLVLLSGHAPNAQLGNGAFQEMRQADLAAPVAKASWACERAETIAADFARAIEIARSGRPGPVHLSLPSDALEAPIDPAMPPTATPSSCAPVHTAPPVLARDDARRLLARLRAAKRPLILAGPFASRGADRDASRALRSACGVPVVSMQSPRGVADPALGAFAPLLARADCILLVGKRLDFTLKFADAPAIAVDCRFLQIEADPLELARGARLLGTRLEASIAASPCGALAILADAAGDAGVAAPEWRDAVDAAIAWRPAAWADARASVPSRVHPAAACRSLQALLDSHPDSVLVSDGGEFGQWAQACLNAPNLVFNGPAGAIGVGLPFAIAASLAKPNAPVVVASGDGSIGFHIAEFDTAVRVGARFVALVGNDARWNAEYQIQLNAYGAKRTVGCELLPTRYDEVAKAFGAFGAHVDDAAALPDAIARARAADLPACLNVLIEGLPAPQMRPS